MPLTYSQIYRVRHYECDAFRIAYQATYLRYMQETAFEASASAGYDPARYWRMGVIWLVRETDLEVLHPLRYEDSVRVTTWVADFRRVRSIRAYEFRLLPSERLVARAQTDWAYLSQADGRPEPIPDEMKAAFFPEGIPEPGPARPRFPPPPALPIGEWRARRRVDWTDLDPAGHVNNATYLAYLENAEFQVGASLGWTVGRLRAERLVLGPSSRRIEYRDQALFGDELELVTGLTQMSTAGLHAYHTISRPRDGALLLRAVAQWGLSIEDSDAPPPIVGSDRGGEGDDEG